MDGISELARMLGKQPDEKRTSTTAQVTRVESDGSIYATVPGGAGEFPVSRSTVEVRSGDTVTVEIADGRATITGSTSAPSISAQRANELLTPIADAVTQAANASAIAQAKADEATESAAKAEVIVDTLDEMAEESGKTVQEILEDAGTAGTAAQAAQTAAKAAQYGLSDVEKVVGTVNWIAEHGQYVNQAGETFDATKTYYTRSGTSPNYTYAIVANPVAADIATYYLLDVDESVQNFLASHVWMDSYGLNLSVDSANGYRIHQGTVDGTQAAGMYILDGGGDIVGTFNVDGIVLGNQESGNYILIDDDSFDVNHVEWVSGSMVSTQIAHFGYGEGVSQSGRFEAPYYTLGMRNEEATEYSTHSVTYNLGQLVTHDGKMYVCKVAIPQSGAWDSSKWQEVVGCYSFAEGEHGVASGEDSHVEGAWCVAIGDDSHAEGGSTVAVGDMGHSQGYLSVAKGTCSFAGGRETIASKYAQTALGVSNVEDTSNTTTHPSGQAVFGKYAVIVGNGDYIDGPSNALAVRWDGLVDVTGTTSYPMFTISAIANWTTKGHPAFVLDTTTKALYYDDGN